jgi:hypothetical protein
VRVSTFDENGYQISAMSARSWYEDGENIVVDDPSCVTEFFYYFLKHATFVAPESMCDILYLDLKKLKIKKI